MLLYYECPTPIFPFAKRRNRTHHNRVNHKSGGKSDDAGGGHNRSYRTAEYQPIIRLYFGCAFFYHCRSPPSLPNYQKFQFENSEVKAMLKNNFNKFSFNLCNFCFSVVTYTKGEKENTNFLHGKEVAQ